MTPISTKEFLQWTLAILLTAAGIAVLAYGPSEKSANAQLSQPDSSPHCED